MTYFTSRGGQDRVAVDPALMWSSAAASYIFIAGVFAFMLFLLDLPLWALALTVVALLLLVRAVSAYFRRRGGRRRGGG